MIATVDLVIAGDASASRAAAVGALRRGQRVLVVLRSSDARVAGRLRRSLIKAAGADGGQLRVVTGAEVVCADGVDGVEAVVLRHARTGRLSAVNASAFVSFDASSQSRRPRSRKEKEARSVDCAQTLIGAGTPEQLRQARVYTWVMRTMW